MVNVIGRDAELAACEAFLARPATGTAALVIEGEPGIGKSTVWAEVVRRPADDHATLVARPAAAEVRLTLSTLADLLADVPPRVVEALPQPQRLAVEAALFRRSSVRSALEPRLLGTALRSVVLALSAERPVLLAIDDLQWVDEASATVLGFALRRLATTRVVLVAARRSSEPSPMDLAGLLGPDRVTAVRLGPMSVAALHHVLREHRRAAVPRSTLVRVHEASGGAPLFALEVMRLLDEIGVPPAGRPLPVPRDLRALVRRRIARLPAPAREVLLAIALTDHASVAGISAALGRPVEADVAAAGRRGFVVVRDGSVELAHPLFAAAVAAEATPAERRVAHEGLARVASNDEARARHRALAAAGPSAKVAAELEATAAGMAGRAGPAAAGALLELAVELTPPGDAADRGRRTILLAGHLQRAGDPVRAQALLREVVASATDPRVRARARLALAGISYELDTPTATVSLCEAALGDAEGDPELLAHAHALVATVSWDDFRRREAHVREAVRLLGEVAAPDPVVEGLVRMQQCETDVAGGRPLDRSIVARGLRLERRAAPAAVSERFSAALGVWRKYLDDFAGARVWLERTVRTARDEGDEGSMPYALSHLPELELWTGRWAEGEAIARRHLELATELGLESQRRQALYNLALLHVHQGREREARDEIRAGLEAAAGDGDTWTEASLVPLLGHLELSLGNAAGAVPLLRRASALRDRVGQETPRRHDADLVEALISAGDPDAAAAVVATMEARARRFARHSALAAAARARGMVEGAQGDLDAAVAALLDALREHDLAPIPFDRARTLLALGVVRRRRRERGAAKDALAEAVRVFDGLGALLWAERARAELDRVGLRRASATELTEGERRVAELAARGLTNREVAAALYVSPKTVEANLARAYAKLGVGSRAELGALLGRPETERGLQP